MFFGSCLKLEEIAGPYRGMFFSYPTSFEHQDQTVLLEV